MHVTSVTLHGAELAATSKARSDHGKRALNCSGVARVQRSLTWRVLHRCRSLTQRCYRSLIWCVAVLAQVLDCSDWSVGAMSLRDFFRAYERGAADGAMLKLKDFPPDAHFRERLPRHHQVRTTLARAL